MRTAAAEPSALSTAEARRGLVGAAAFGGVGLLLSGLYAAAGVGVPCPLRWLTGWWCPLCGATRMGAALLRGDVATAWAANPFVMLGLLVLGVRVAWWLVEVASGRRWPLPGTWRAPAAWVQRHWLALTAVTGVGYAVLRNVP